MIQGRRLLFLTLLIALGLRIAAARGVQYALDEHLHRAFLIEGDADGYWQLAEKIRRGDTYALYDPPRYVQRMPGFPIVLASGMWLGRGDPLVVRLLLSVLGTLACWLVFLLGRRMFDESTALIAAFLAAVSPTMIGFSVIMLSETVFATTMLVCLLTICGLVREMKGDFRRSLVWATLVGASTGIATLVRPSWILVAPACCVGLAVWGRGRWVALAQSTCVLAACTLVLLPWMSRNRLVTGHWVATTLWAGASLYDGWNPAADGGSNMQFFERDRLMTRMSEYEVDRQYRRLACDYAWTHPRRVVELAVLKMKRFWSLWPTSDVLRRLDVRLIMTAYFVPVLLLGLRGGWLVRFERWHLLLCVGPLLYFSAIHLVFVGSLRYRLPAEFPFLLLSALGGRALLPSGGDVELRSIDTRPAEART
ncbi:MAG: glycosyltransferase family 39 protein [Planctomycetaceae bacterium]